MRKIAKYTAATAVVGAGVGAVMYRRRLKENSAVPAHIFNAQQDQSAISEEIKLLLSNKGGGSPAKLFRYSTCPYCGVVKTFLDLHKIPHECVEVEPIFKSEIASHRYSKVPQLQLKPTLYGPLIVDSAAIIDTLCEKLPTSRTDGNSWKAQLSHPDVQKWREFAREKLVRFLVININSSLLEAWRGYSYIDQHDTIAPHNKLFLKFIGAPVMFLVSRLKTLPALEKKYGYDKSKVPPQEALRGVMTEWALEGLTGKPFHGGKRPDLADVEVYGVLQSIRGHRVYTDIEAHAAVKEWLDRMDQAVGKTDSIYKV
ncbi:glutathione-S-transferase/glutaredoxin [Perkinsela sp. CCAP 1560/4]|nr:glutathione-S-transferase/glutaredoxin [Perkinsela sp. CCAP 1560/4]KNH08266.1 glutathione-S-transferase/glutaredoxin [Perkinsela sp. CCAP 1560/4]|eukprot:KNH06970.1 glutathione-S-transferase/glutaredoxin [Perkinsela sp. CCAP 1560/4]